jgi:hypothetical protein
MNLSVHDFSLPWSLVVMVLTVLPSPPNPDIALIILSSVLVTPSLSEADCVHHNSGVKVLISLVKTIIFHPFMLFVVSLCFCYW